MTYCEIVISTGVRGRNYLSTAGRNYLSTTGRNYLSTAGRNLIHQTATPAQSAVMAFKISPIVDMTKKVREGKYVITASEFPQLYRSGRSLILIAS